MSEVNVANQSRVVRALSAVERMGQRLPDPLTLFFAMSALVVLVSGVFAGVSADVVQRSGGALADPAAGGPERLLLREGVRDPLHATHLAQAAHDGPRCGHRVADGAFRGRAELR